MLKNVVVDLSHWNQNVDFSLAKKDGILCVIHKASQGVNAKDPKYAERAIAAQKASLLWAAYHFGTGTDGAKQAQFFLNTINSTSNRPVFVALDIETNQHGPSMTPKQAEDFVEYIAEKTSKKLLCLVYGSTNYLENGFSTPTLTSCLLWLAHYAETPLIPKGWENFVLWQYTDGKSGPEPHSVNGIGNCDRDKLNKVAAQELGFDWLCEAKKKSGCCYLC